MFVFLRPKDLTIIPKVSPSISTIRFRIASALAFIDSSISSFTSECNMKNSGDEKRIWRSHIRVANLILGNVSFRPPITYSCGMDQSKADLLADYSILTFGYFSKLRLDLLMLREHTWNQSYTPLSCVSVDQVEFQRQNVRNAVKEISFYKMIGKTWLKFVSIQRFLENNIWKGH